MKEEHELLTNRRWMQWKSVKTAWDAELVNYMSDKEKLKTIGRPVYAFAMNGYSIGYVAFYFLECEQVYPKWILDNAISYYEKKYYPGLRKAYEELLLSRQALTNM